MLSVETLLDADLASQVRERIFAPQLAAFDIRLDSARVNGQVDAADPLVALELFVAPLFHRWQQGTAPLTHAYAGEIALRASRALRP